MSACQAEDRGFESRRSRQKTDLLSSGRFFFLDIANRAQEWYNNMAMKEASQPIVV